MKKKGVELSMNVIIIAAIGLLVLVILAVLVINAGGKTQIGMQNCNALGGTCQDSCTAGTSAIDKGTPSCNGKTCCPVFVANPTG